MCINFLFVLTSLKSILKLLMLSERFYLMQMLDFSLMAASTSELSINNYPRGEIAAVRGPAI